MSNNIGRSFTALIVFMTGTIAMLFDAGLMTLISWSIGARYYVLDFLALMLAVLAVLTTVIPWIVLLSSRFHSKVRAIILSATERMFT